MLVAERSQDDPHFGMTKLNKILFFTDFTAYQRTGQSVTGATYQHLDQGPCPQQLIPVIRALGDGVRQMEEQTYAGTQRRLQPTRPADVAMFSGTDISILDEILRLLRPMTARQASDLSHDTMAWRLTKDRQEVPYSTAVLSEEAPTDEDVAWLEGVAHGRLAAN